MPLVINKEMAQENLFFMKSQQTKIVNDFFFLQSGNMTKCLPSPLLFRMTHEVLARAVANLAR